MDDHWRIDRYLAKLHRAEAHLEEFREAVDVFMQEDAHRLITDLDLEEGDQIGEAVVYSAAQDWNRERDWGLLIGDIAHNLRSCLDYIAYQLACLVQDPPKGERDVGFPLFTNSADFEKKRWRIKYLKTDHQAFVERYQPYDPVLGNPANPEEHPLWILSELDNADKHRLIAVTAVVAQFRNLVPVTRDLEILGEEIFPRVGLERNAVVARYHVRQTGANSDIHVKAEGSFQVVFGEGSPAAEEGVFATLYAMRDAVRGIVAMVGGQFT